VDEHSIGMYLTMIERDHNYYMNKFLKKYNLGKHDIRVLKEVNAHNDISQNEICEILKEDKITVSKSVKNLVALGYVERKKDSEDKRITRLSMTEKGKKDRSEIMSIMKNTNDVFSRRMNGEDVEKVLALLKCMSDNMHKEVLRIRDEN